MGFASPCGNKIEELSNMADKNSVYPLPYVIKGNDVSFSGLLTAAKRLIRDKKHALSDICFSLQETAFSIIVEAVERALSFTEKKEFLIVGGVSANNRLSQMLHLACEYHGSIFKSCPLRFCGDNGAQIAWTGLQSYSSFFIFYGQILKKHLYLNLGDWIQLIFCGDNCQDSLCNIFPHLQCEYLLPIFLDLELQICKWYCF